MKILNTITFNKINVKHQEKRTSYVPKIVELKKDSVSFSGSSSAKLKLPEKELFKLLKQKTKEILATNDFKIQEELLDQLDQKSTNLINDSVASIRENRNIETDEMLTVSEVNHDLGNVIGLMANSVKKDSKSFVESTKLYKDTIKLYQFILDNDGLKNKSINDIFNLVFNHEKGIASKKGIKVKVENQDVLINHKGPTYLNKLDIFSTFHNIIQNAIKYSPDNSKIRIGFQEYTKEIENPVYIELKRFEKNPRVPATIQTKGICFKVQDNGIGIPESEKEKVLNMQGARASNALKSGIHGTGFGLPKTYRNLKQRYGTIEIVSPLPGKSLSDEFPGTEMQCYICSELGKV